MCGKWLAPFVLFAALRADAGGQDQGPGQPLDDGRIMLRNGRPDHRADKAGGRGVLRRRAWRG